MGVNFLNVHAMFRRRELTQRVMLCICISRDKVY